MKKSQAGNKNLPDFKELNDRIIADASNTPTLVIKTNLDPKDTKEDNPYYQGNSADQGKFSAFFDEENEI